jgi:hypothetical protein
LFAEQKLLDVEQSGKLLSVLKTEKLPVPPAQLKLITLPTIVAVNPVIPPLATGEGTEKFMVLLSLP